MRYAVVVQLVRNQWITELPQPEFEQRCKDMRIIDTVEAIISFIDTNFEIRYRIPVSGDTENAFGFGAAQRQNPICEERKNNRDFLVGIVPFL